MTSSLLMMEKVQTCVQLTILPLSPLDASLGLGIGWLLLCGSGRMGRRPHVEHTTHDGGSIRFSTIDNIAPLTLGRQPGFRYRMAVTVRVRQDGQASACRTYYS
jgi:hypothetical protein